MGHSLDGNLENTHGVWRVEELRTHGMCTMTKDMLAFSERWDGMRFFLL